MSTITISKTQYQKLLEKALRYDYLESVVKQKEDIFASPPTRDIKEIITSFRATGHYSAAFLKSLEKGLKRSSYFSRPKK